MFNKFYLFLGSVLSKIDAVAEEKFLKRIIPNFVSGNVLAQYNKCVYYKDFEKRKKKIVSYKWIN